MNKTSKMYMPIKSSGVKSPGLKMRDLEGVKAQHSQRGTVTILSPGGLSPVKKSCHTVPGDQGGCQGPLPTALLSHLLQQGQALLQPPERLCLTSCPAPSGKHPPGTAGTQVLTEERGKE